MARLSHFCVIASKKKKETLTIRLPFTHRDVRTHIQNGYCGKVCRSRFFKLISLCCQRNGKIASELKYKVTKYSRLFLIKSSRTHFIKLFFNCFWRSDFFFLSSLILFFSGPFIFFILGLPQIHFDWIELKFCFIENQAVSNWVAKLLIFFSMPSEFTKSSSGCYLLGVLL